MLIIYNKHLPTTLKGGMIYYGRREKTVSKKKKKPTKLKYSEILITALMDLIIGTLLLIIGKIVE